MFTFALRFKPVQQILVQKATTYLSKAWNTKVQIGELYYIPFSDLSIRDLYVADQDQDTLFSAGHITAALDIRALLQGDKIVVRDLSLVDAGVSLKQYENGKTNFSFILDLYQDTSSTASQGNKNNLVLDIPTLRFSNLSLKYQNLAHKDRSVKGVNYQNAYIYDLSGVLSNLDLKQHLFKADVEALSFGERSGLQVRNFSGEVLIDKDQMVFSDLDLGLNQSRIKGQFTMDYADFSDFSDFVHKVHLNGIFKDSKISSSDIAFFAPDVALTNFNVWLEGAVSGTVDDLRGQGMTLRPGKTTWLSGDIRIQGLPRINQTLFTMHVSHLSTNAQELETLVAELSGKSAFQLPTLLERLGNVDYRGEVSGFYNDFTTKGIFKTKLGDVTSDVHLDLKEQGKYQGDILVHNFELGKFLRDSLLGQTTFRLNLEGSGFKLDDLSEKFNTKLDFIDYKGYRYRDIAFVGDFLNGRLNGDLRMVDPNLDLDGKVAWTADSGISQKFQVEGNLNHVDLHALHLYSKDTLAISGAFSADFSGSDFNTAKGVFQAHDFQLKTAEGIAYVDSLQLTAGGDESERLLQVQSSIFNGTLKGQYNLNSLPNYFKRIAQYYIPSWKTTVEPVEALDFSIEVDVKEFTPIALLFLPGLEIPKNFYLSGRFSSVDRINSLNGYIEELKYKGMVARDIIIDQTAEKESLDLFVTSDRLDVTDSLRIHNINISNVLKQDSLSFNVKLSNPDDPNQLDLNGLIEFNAQGAARLSLLPSDVILNYNDWRLQEKVRFDFEEDKTLLNGFELSNGNQVIRMDGVISNSESDMLNLNFEHFSLETFNALTRTLGIELKGELNGEMAIRSLLHNPYIQSDIITSDMYYNNTLIGDMDLQAGLDQNTKLVHVKAEITKQDVPTLQLEGTYDASRRDNNLDIELRMQNNELVIFQPFLSNLVSDLSGSATAALRVQGSVFRPIIDGFAELRDASFIVNYLQTAYTINDGIEVKNSVIHLDEVLIEDVNKQRAIATGTVDMKKPSVPIIHVDIQADQFMALNTTAKDNPLYYGIAFGTGTFAFNGPTDNMDIRIDATTNSGTIFNIPLNSVGTLTDQDFIRFVSTDTTTIEARENAFQGLTMILDLNVTDEAQANIYTDLGRLSGNGTGLLSMHITSMGDFEMFGDYSIATGEFEFTAQDYINKVFALNRGGTIRWTGNPTEALINLVAVYEVRTSIAPLYTAAGRGSNETRVQAQAEMMLNGSLLHPEIGFGINFPQDSYVKDELQSYFSDANNVNQQALSLIVRRSFAPGTGTNLTRELNTTVLSAGTELAFNQLNNIISQSLNLNFVDFNIRSFNEASASIRLLNDRLILTGGVTDRRGQLNDFNVFGKEVASDVEALYLIRKSGNLLLRASNRLSNRNFLNPTDEYISALGLVYRQEFDTFGEFFRRMLRLKSNPALSVESVKDSTDTAKFQPDSIQKTFPKDSIYFK